MTAADAARRARKEPASGRARGTVTAVNAGPPATLTVTVAGSSLTLRRLKDTYAINDEVIIDTAGRDWIVLGVLA